MKKSLFVFLALLAVFSVGAQDLIIANGAEPASLDPALMTDTTSSNIGFALNEGLMVYDPRTSKGIPAMAESYSTSPDGMVVTFKIRKDALWSDGTPVKAQDFVYGWLRTLNPDTASEYAYMLTMVIKGAAAYNEGKDNASDVGVKAVDDKTLQVTLVGPAAYFPDMTAHHAFEPAPKWAIDKHGSNWTKPGNYVGTGAYILKEWKPQDYILVEKNPKYWDAKNVKLKSIKYLASDNSTTNYKMYKAGAVDWQVGITVDLIDEIMLRKDYQVSARFGTYYLSVNNTRAPFDNANVRKAFAAAIDKKTLVDKVLKGGQIPTDAFTPAMVGYTPQPGVGYDPAAAKKYLAAAGYPDGKGFPPPPISTTPTKATRRSPSTSSNSSRPILESTSPSRTWSGTPSSTCAPSMTSSSPVTDGSATISIRTPCSTSSSPAAATTTGCIPTRSSTPPSRLPYALPATRALDF